MWAKISNSTTKMACVACIAVAATLPAAGSSAEKLSQDAAIKLAADPVTQLDAFSGIPNYLAFLTTGDINKQGSGESDAFSSLSATALTDIDVVSAIPVLQQVLGGNIGALAGPLGDGVGGYAALSAVPALLQGNVTALDAFSAVPDLLSGNITALDAFSAVPNLISFATTGDLSRATGLSGIDAFSALPVYNALLQGDIGALAPDSAGVGGIAGFSAIPGFLGIPATDPAPDFPSTSAPLAAQSNSTLTTLSEGSGGTGSGGAAKLTGGGSNPIKTFVANLPKPQVFTPPADPKVDPAQSDPPASSDNKKLTITPYSEKFAPKGIGDNPLLFGSGNGGADNGMPGWQNALKGAGIGGGDASGQRGMG